jgi:hypothetical protein
LLCGTTAETVYSVPWLASVSVLRPRMTSTSLGSILAVLSPPGSLSAQASEQSGSVSATQWAAVATIREVSSDPPQNCRWWAFLLKDCAVL